MKTKHYTLGTILAVTLLVVGVWVQAPPVAHAADNDFSNGITVDSTDDTPDDNIGDNICDDGDGNCTLRAAIEESNATAGTQTINFNITGAADFTNGGQNGYTISPASGLPAFTGTVVINGYSQPGARINTAISPRPLDGLLLIEIDGTNAGSGTRGFDVSSSANDVVIRGLVINSFDATGVCCNSGGARTNLQGNYIGTDPTGLIDRGNNGTAIHLGEDALIGGLDPEDRNIISGNQTGAISPNTGDDNMVVQGNYIGVGADGKTLLPNSQPGGNGALSLDNSTGHVIGGDQEGAGNVISGNSSFAIAPDNTSELSVKGNIIGPDWEGKHIPGSLQAGGIGMTAIVGAISDVLIANNTIAYNNGPGITAVSTTVSGNPYLAISNISILGNSIYDNVAGGAHPLAQTGLGIDLTSVNLNDFVFTSRGPTLNDATDIDNGSNNYINFPVLNSAKQTGTNLALNYDLDAADSPSDEYRVEFFANDTADPSGYGEGQTFLGAVTASNGSGNTATLTLPNGTDLTGKVISATTTAVDNTTDSGFGSTSEFSAVLGAEVVSSQTITSPASSAGSGSLAQTGQNSRVSLLIVVTLVTAATATMTAKRKYVYKARP